MGNDAFGYVLVVLLVAFAVFMGEQVTKEAWGLISMTVGAILRGIGTGGKA